MKKLQHAFTLIELLVVIAIIAILAALVFPAIRISMENARSKDDLAKLRGLGQGITQYLVDSKDTFFNKEGDKDATWSKLLKKRYVQDWAAFRSPFDGITIQRPKKDEDPIPVSYAMNDKLFEVSDEKDPKMMVRWTAPKTQLIMLAPAVEMSGSNEKLTFRADALNTNHLAMIPPESAAVEYGTHTARTKINVLFVDGNVTEMDWARFADTTTKKGKRQWDPFYDEDEN